MSATVIGVGNRLRRDDGAGLAVIDRLRRDLPAGVEAVALEHVPPDLYEHWSDAERVFLVDASSSGSDPGSVLRFNPADAPLPASSVRLSTHGFGLSEAIELARALGRLPSRLIVFAIEGGEFSDGQGLSSAVETAAEQVARTIQDELEAPNA